MLLEQTRPPMYAPVEKVDKTSTLVGDEYWLGTSPINKEHFASKINYWSYFNLMGVPVRARIDFHAKARQMNLFGAMASIRPFIKGKNYRLILQHLDNAIERYDTVTTK